MDGLSAEVLILPMRQPGRRLASGQCCRLAPGCVTDLARGACTLQSLVESHLAATQIIKGVKNLITSSLPRLGAPKRSMPVISGSMNRAQKTAAKRLIFQAQCIVFVIRFAMSVAPESWVQCAAAKQAGVVQLTTVCWPNLDIAFIGSAMASLAGNAADRADVGKRTPCG